MKARHEPLTTRVLAAVALASLGGVGAALFTQYVWDMQPCPWCVLQRLICVAIALCTLPALLWRRRGVQLASSTGVFALALCGVAAALWQHFVAAASASCNLTLADRIVDFTGLGESLPQVFAAYASCADAKASLAGLPYEFWSLGLFAALAAAGLWVLRRRAAG